MNRAAIVDRALDSTMIEVVGPVAQGGVDSVSRPGIESGFDELDVLLRHGPLSISRRDGRSADLSATA